jgi:hypothetical protein
MELEKIVINPDNRPKINKNLTIRKKMDRLARQYNMAIDVQEYVQVQRDLIMKSCPHGEYDSIITNTPSTNNLWLSKTCKACGFSWQGGNYSEDDKEDQGEQGDSNVEPEIKDKGALD